MTSARSTIVLASGGTGGHVFPARSVGAVLSGRGHRVIAMTDTRGARFGDVTSVMRIQSGSPSGSPAKVAGAIGRLGIGTLQTLWHFKRLRPACVVGFGGYPSVPAIMAAWMLRIPSILHEQNAVLGRANRLLARRADHLALSFETVQGVEGELTARSSVTGNPVRGDIARLASSAYVGPVTEEPLRVLVIGGSQGARVFSDVVPAAVALLPQAQQERLSIVQQARSEDLERARGAYRGLHATVELSPFFEDMPARLASAHLVIARSGASTLAELTSAGRPSILVPYPFATDDHQMANAQALDESGGSWLIPQHAFTPEALANRLEMLLNLPSTLNEVAAAAQAQARPQAAEAVADLVEHMIAERAGSPAPENLKQRAMA